MPLVAYDINPRCGNCGKLLAVELTWPWKIQCVRCKAENTHETRAEPAQTVVLNVADTTHP